MSFHISDTHQETIITTHPSTFLLDMLHTVSYAKALAYQISKSSKTVPHNCMYRKRSVPALWIRTEKCVHCCPCFQCQYRNCQTVTVQHRCCKTRIPAMNRNQISHHSIWSSFLSSRKAAQRTLVWTYRPVAGPAILVRPWSIVNVKRA